MDNLRKEFIDSIICSVVGALIGQVTPNLRAVNVEIGTVITMFFFYDNVPTEDEEELANIADTEFLSDYPDLPSAFKIVHLPYPQKIPDGLRIFERYE